MRLLFLLGFAFIFTACAHEIEYPAPALVQPVSAKADTAIVVRGDVERVEQYRAFVRFMSEGLFFRDTGGLRFGEYHVRSGERVKEGQLLATLDTERIREQIEEQEERLDRLRTEQGFESASLALDIDIARAEYVNLFRTENYNEQQMEAAEWKRLEIERLEIEFMQLSERHALTMEHSSVRLNELKERLPESELRAPYDGIITFLVSRNPGDNVAAFSPLAYISDETFSFIEPAGDEAISFSRNQLVKAFYNDTVYDLVRVPVSRVEHMFYSARRMSAPLRFMLSDPGQKLPPPGTFITIRIYSGVAEDVLRIPANSLYHSLEVGTYVYRMENGQKVPVEVEIGLNTDVYTEIRYGLEEGDEVYVKP
jgi:multidrug efflux pump subunit AcrA (membrane-fusion protein)